MAYSGSCLDMCPEAERRARFGLYMSIFERNQDNQPDEYAMVKEYRRSGADQEEPKPEDLRTLRALELTMDYLVCNVLDDPRSLTAELSLEWYDFLWDRLRAIRKDITQQNICDQAAATLVERCARFHVHSCYAMNRVKDFDVDMNKRNLNDCLQMLRQIYHDLKTINGVSCPGELEFQKYDILLHLNEDHLSSVVLMKTSDYRSSTDMKFITKIFNVYTNNDYYKFFQLMSTADYMTSCILSLYADKMRIIGFKTIINACAPRQTNLYPVELLIEALGFDNLDDLRTFATGLNIELQEKGNKFYIGLNKEHLVSIRRFESLTPAFKSRHLVENKRQDKSVGQLVYGSTEFVENPYRRQPVAELQPFEVEYQQDVTNDNDEYYEDEEFANEDDEENCSQASESDIDDCEDRVNGRDQDDIDSDDYINDNSNDHDSVDDDDDDSVAEVDEVEEDKVDINGFEEEELVSECDQKSAIQAMDEEVVSSENEQNGKSSPSEIQPEKEDFVDEPHQNGSIWVQEYKENNINRVEDIQEKYLQDYSQPQMELELEPIQSYAPRYTVEEIADLMPVGCYKVQSLKSKCPKLVLPPDYMNKSNNQ